MPGSEGFSLLDISDKNWNSFVNSFPEANIFYHPGWCELLADCYGFRPFIFQSGSSPDNIQAGLPIMEVKSWITGRRWISLPFTDYCAPLYKGEDCLNQLSGELVSWSQTQKIPKIEVRWELPALPGIQTQSDFVLHRLNLNPDADQVLSKFHRTQRQNIRTAEKNGVQIIRGEELEHLRTFYELHSLTRRRHGVPVQPWHFFELILDKFIRRGLGFILLAYHEEHCLAAGVFLHWNQTLTYKYSASNDFGQDLRPNHLINWTAIRWGCEQGFRIFDFGRTELADEGLRTFKNRWGAQEVPLTYSTFSTQASSSASGRLMTGLQKVIQKSPVWVGRLVGEALYKHSA